MIEGTSSPAWPGTRRIPCPSMKATISSLVEARLSECMESGFIVGTLSVSEPFPDGTQFEKPFLLLISALVFHAATVRAGDRDGDRLPGHGFVQSCGNVVL